MIKKYNSIEDRFSKQEKTHKNKKNPKVLGRKKGKPAISEKPENERVFKAGAGRRHCPVYVCTLGALSSFKASLQGGGRQIIDEAG